MEIIPLEYAALAPRNPRVRIHDVSSASCNGELPPVIIANVPLIESIKEAVLLKSIYRELRLLALEFADSTLVNFFLNGFVSFCTALSMSRIPISEEDISRAPVPSS